MILIVKAAPSIHHPVCLPDPFRPVVRHAKHLAVGEGGRAAIAPRLDVVGLHLRAWFSRRDAEAQSNQQTDLPRPDGLRPVSGVSREQIRLFDFFAEQVQLHLSKRRCGITGRSKALQFQRVEVHREVLEEVAFPRIVSVAQDALALEVMPVVLEFVLDERRVRAKLVLLVSRRIMQIAFSLSRHSCLPLVPGAAEEDESACQKGGAPFPLASYPTGGAWKSPGRIGGSRKSAPLAGALLPTRRSSKKVSRLFSGTSRCAERKIGVQLCLVVPGG